MLSLKNISILHKISPKGAIGVSIALHLFFSTVFAAFWAGSIEQHNISPIDEIVLELEPVKFSPTFDNQDYGVSNPDAAKESGKVSNNTKGNMSREAILKASLASMEDFIKPFEFVAKAIVSDSTGGFSPVEGDIPGSAFESFGTKNGEGKGRGNGIRISVGGGGTCKPGGGPIILP